MCRVGGLHSFQHRIVWRSEKEEELERDDDKSWTLYAQTDDASSSGCGVRVPPNINNPQLPPHFGALFLLSSTQTIPPSFTTSNTITFKMSQRPEPLRLGSVAPNFDADTTNG